MKAHKIHKCVSTVSFRFIEKDYKSVQIPSHKHYSSLGNKAFAIESQEPFMLTHPLSHYLIDYYDHFVECIGM